MIVLMLATAAVWVSAAGIVSMVTSPDNGTLLILGIFAFLSTAVIWTVGGNVAVAQNRASRRTEYPEWDTSKPKRMGTDTLTSVVEGLTPGQIASLEIALQRRRESYDEDDQILANRLSAEMERSQQTGRL